MTLQLYSLKLGDSNGVTAQMTISIFVLSYWMRKNRD
jgi:hypothetical protein